MNNPIFPTFDEIKEGYCVYERQGAYKGEDDYGTPIFGRRLSRKVSIQHGWYDKYITIDIVLSRRTNAPIGFKFGYDDKCGLHTDMSIQKKDINRCSKRLKKYCNTM